MEKVRRIVIDLEMNPISKKLGAVRSKLSREIIEIGAYMIDEQNKMIGDFHCYVKPAYNDNIAPFITKLTGIRFYDVANAVSFEKALNQLERWIGYEYETLIYSWSYTDLHQITTECKYKEINLPANMSKWIDFQAEYYKIMALDSSSCQPSLHKAAEQFGIVMEDNKSHSALYDAMITSDLIISFLNGDYILQRNYLQSINVSTI